MGRNQMLMCEPAVSSRTTPRMLALAEHPQGTDRGEVDRMLREIAYVLNLTRRVKDGLGEARN